MHQEGPEIWFFAYRAGISFNWIFAGEPPEMRCGAMRKIRCAAALDANFSGQPRGRARLSLQTFEEACESREIFITIYQLREINFKNSSSGSLWTLVSSQLWTLVSSQHRGEHSDVDRARAMNKEFPQLKSHASPHETVLSVELVSLSERRERGVNNFTIHVRG